MKIRSPWLVACAGWCIAMLVRTWMRTIRFEYHPQENRYDPNDPGFQGRYLYCFWHEHILVPASKYARRDIQVLISKHADGQMIARACKSLGFSTVAGSSTRGGAEAVKELVRQGESCHLAITPDGPKGPRRQVQQGVGYLALKTNLPVVAFGVAYSSCWRFNSWDRFALPKPFSRAVLVTACPLEFGQEMGRGMLEKATGQVQAALDEVNQRAEEILRQSSRGGDRTSAPRRQAA